MSDLPSVTEPLPSDDINRALHTDCFEWCSCCGGIGTVAAPGGRAECWWCRGAGVLVGIDDVSNSSKNNRDNGGE